MDDSIIETTRKHGEQMYQLALKHSLETAKLFRDYEVNSIDHLIIHLEEKLAREENENV